MAKKKATDYIAEWMDEYSKDHPYELAGSEFVKEAGVWYLRVFIDKLENGEYVYVGSDDCEEVSRFLSARLDEEDPITQNYYLEVSSPGLDRPLISEKDFMRFMGSDIEISLYKAIDGKKQYTGRLTAYNGGRVTFITEENKEISILCKDAAKINLAVVF